MNQIEDRVYSLTDDALSFAADIYDALEQIRYDPVGATPGDVEAMKEVGCVYLAATGGAAVSYAEGLSRVTGYDWLDLGMPEALWHFQTRALGPLVVAIDAEGNSLYDKVREKVAENLKKI